MSGESPNLESEIAPVELMLTYVSETRLKFTSRRNYPLKTRLYLNATAPTIEYVRATGLEITLTEQHKAAKHFEYVAILSNADGPLLDWLQEVLEQGPPSERNQHKYVRLHLDRRKKLRPNVTFRVLSQDLGPYIAMTTDLSDTGMRLRVPIAVTPNRTLRMQLHFDDGSFGRVEALGKVLWCQEYDKYFIVGMQFVEISEDARSTVKKYIKRVITTRKRFT